VETGCAPAETGSSPGGWDRARRYGRLPCQVDVEDRLPYAIGAPASYSTTNGHGVQAGIEAQTGAAMDVLGRVDYTLVGVPVSATQVAPWTMIIICDKSTIQSLNRDQAFWLGIHYRANIAPIFLTEVLMDPLDRASVDRMSDLVQRVAHDPVALLYTGGWQCFNQYVSYSFGHRGASSVVVNGSDRCPAEACL
jgi:hypothetical protein